MAITGWAAMASAASVTLHWTAPGDDSLTGRATQYDLRYSFGPITSSLFSTAARFPVPAPKAAGGLETAIISGLTAGTNYYFAIKTADEANNWSVMSNVIVIRADGSTVGVGDSPATAIQFSTPRPNPARSKTSFALTLPQATRVHIAAFDIQGRMVKTLMSEERPPGELRLVWNLDDSDGNQLSPGVYMVRATLGSQTFDRRVAVVR